MHSVKAPFLSLQIRRYDTTSSPAKISTGEETKQFIFNERLTSTCLNSNIDLPLRINDLILHFVVKRAKIMRYLAINRNEKLTFSQRRRVHAFLVVDESRKTTTNLKACAVCSKVSISLPVVLILVIVVVV